MTQPTAPPDVDAPPRPNYRRRALITTAFLGLWLFLTLGSRQIAPVLASFVDRVEVALGLDVSLGERTE